MFFEVEEVSGDGLWYVAVEGGKVGDDPPQDDGVDLARLEELLDLDFLIVDVLLRLDRDGQQGEQEVVVAQQLGHAEGFLVLLSQYHEVQHLEEELVHDLLLGRLRRLRVGGGGCEVLLDGGLELVVELSPVLNIVVECIQFVLLSELLEPLELLHDPGDRSG